MKKVFFVFLMTVSAIFAAFAQELPRLAVVAFSTNNNSDKTMQDAITVRNLVESQLGAIGKYKIVTRDEIDKLLANQQIQVSSISSDENIKKLKLENISYIVTGSVNAMESDYAVTVKILDVSNGQFPHTADDFMGGSSRELYDGLNKLITRFVSGMNASGGQVVQTGQGGRQVTYKIGDTGPGGGIVFAVEGNTGMEVSRILGTYTWHEAVNVARNYRGGDKTDWRLPDGPELNLMWENLHKPKVINLGSGSYWGSSQGNSKYAWVQVFGEDGRLYTIDTIEYKHVTNSVRAVRTF